MGAYKGKYLAAQRQKGRLSRFPSLISLFFIEVFSFRFLMGQQAAVLQDLWPLALGLVWSVLLWAVLGLLPGGASRVGYGLVYLSAVVIAVGQTGYYLLFGDMIWLSDFRYASEGADYLDVLLSYPVQWYLGIFLLIAAGLFSFLRYPGEKKTLLEMGTLSVLAVMAAALALVLPQKTFAQDADIQYAGSNYGRSKSAEAVYENMFDPYRLYQLCGLYHTAAKDLWEHNVYPLTPQYRQVKQLAKEQIGEYFRSNPRSAGENEMTGLLEGKHAVLVLMESVDDWMIGEDTPALCRLMEEGIRFTNFYTPAYGGIRTFNTEFCINTGSYLSGKGGYALDYATNSYDHTLAAQLTAQGYSAEMFHYNDPTFYSRDVFSEALGYSSYVCYGDYLSEYTEKEKKQLLYDDQLLFDNPQLRERFFRPAENRLNFVITRSAHLSYKYNEVLSHWGLKRYPQYRGLTGSEETDCALLKARLVDDFFARLLEELEAQGELQNTVIIGVTDHYTYGYKDTQRLLELSGVTDVMLLEKTPCFIWSADMEPRTVDKFLNTADFLPTVLNLLGIESEYTYIGQDAFSGSYDGFVPFSNGGWISARGVYDGAKRALLPQETAVPVSEEYIRDMCQRTQAFSQINSLILETDYYREAS